MLHIDQTDEGDPMQFQVVVRKGQGETRHTVTMRQRDYETLAPEGASPEDVVLGSFRFLLDREDKDQILSEFDITSISRYFPEYEAELPGYLD